MRDKAGKINVLIVDDALFMRKAIGEILESDPNIKVVGTAKDGFEALEKIKSLNPDVVTLDIDMPRMDGIETIRHIMIESPVPIVVLSSLFSDGIVTFDALRLGVIDFLPKPSGVISEDIDRSRNQIIERIKIAGSINFKNIRRVKVETCMISSGEAEQCGLDPPEYLVSIGTSLTGSNTVIRLLTRLSTLFSTAILVMLEIAPQILPAFVKKFQEHASWKMKIAQNGQIIENGVCYICSNDNSLTVECDHEGRKTLKVGEKIKNPLNHLYESSAKAFKEKAIGVLLTGVGDDGADGLGDILEKNGMTLAQDGKCCIHPNLTQNAIQKNTVSSVVDESQLQIAIVSAMS